MVLIQSSTRGRSRCTGFTSENFCDEIKQQKIHPAHIFTTDVPSPDGKVAIWYARSLNAASLKSLTSTWKTKLQLRVLVVRRSGLDEISPGAEAIVFLIFRFHPLGPLIFLYLQYAVTKYMARFFFSFLAFMFFFPGLPCTMMLGHLSQHAD